MQFQRFFARAGAALAMICVCGTAPATTSPVEASTPPFIWRDVERVNVLCLVQGDSGISRGPLHDLVCNAARDAAAAGSPAPVALIAAGDPAVLAPASVTLLVHAAVQGRGSNRLLAFTVRPFRNSAEPLLFAAAPRAVPLASPEGPAPEFEAALRAALSETLPWLSRPAGARPIR